MTRIDPEQRKQYNKQYHKEYRQRRDVKQKDIEGKNTKNVCGYGVGYTNKMKARHNRSKTHIAWVACCVVPAPEEPKAKMIVCECDGRYNIKHKAIHETRGIHTKWYEENIMCSIETLV
jgi:hypothetical protein